MSGPTLVTFVPVLFSDRKRSGFRNEDPKKEGGRKVSLPSIIVLLQLGIILVASIVFGGRVPLKSVPASEWAWVIVFTPVLLAEVYLIVFHQHTLSGQMQWWVREHKLSGFFVVFWGWLAWHFALEPAVRGVRGLMRRWLA